MNMYETNCEKGLTKSQVQERINRGLVNTAVDSDFCVFGSVSMYSRFIQKFNLFAGCYRKHVNWNISGNKGKKRS